MPSQQDVINKIKQFGLSVARGVPQAATGMVDLAALPFTMSGLLAPDQVVGSTDWATRKGYLPPAQPGLLNETAELTASLVNPLSPVGKVTSRALAPLTQGKTYRDAFYQAQAPAVMSKIFIGEKAKTWDKGAAEAFKKLEEQGVGNKEAWQQTGTFRSPDGKLRQEIDDSNAEFIKKGFEQLPSGTLSSKGSSLKNVFSHEPAYSSYPELAKIDPAIMIGGDGYFAGSGSFNPIKNLLTARGSNNQKAKGTTLHELQHAIQEVEDFGSGGSPGLLSPLVSASPDVEKNVAAWSKYAELMTGEPAGMKRLGDFDYVDDFLDDTVPSYSADFDQKLSKQDAGQLKGLLVDAGLDPKEVSKEISSAQKMGTYAGFAEWIGGKMRDRLSGSIFSPQERYELLPGEIESRLVERRMGLTPEQRRQYFPLDQGQYGIDVDPMRVKELEDAQKAYSRQFQMVPYNRSLLAD